jgi:DNA-binding transcriptional regulator YiaG
MTAKIEPSEAETRILQAMNELQERLKIERTKSAALVELRAFLDKRPLLTRHVLWGFVKSLPSSTAKRGKRAVKSRKGIDTRTRPPVGALGTAINKARTAKGWSRTEFADKIGCHNSLISHWERAVGRPGEALRPKISKVLGLDVEALIARDKTTNGHAAP